MSLVTTAAQQNAALTQAANAAAAGNTSTSTVAGGASASTASSTGPNALSSLTGNFNNFLKLLMTQLQNQDPTTPMDTSQFTTQLVQFASVEQQINTNTSLTQLIQLTQAGEVLQSSAMVGHKVAVTSNQMPLQNGTGEVQFTAPAAGPVAIAIYNGSGTQIADATVQATAGTNSWTWNGQDGSGNQRPDGTYQVAVMGLNSAGTPSALPFTVIGTATGVQQQNNTLQLQLGSDTVAFSAVQSIVN